MSSRKSAAMKRAVKFKTAESSGPVRIPSHDTVNWTLCFLCQTHTSKELECPARRKGSDVTGYKYVADNLKAFEELGEFPGKVSIEKLTEGYGDLETALREHKASYHKNCRTRVGTAILNRKKKSTDTHLHASPAKTRRKHKVELGCFFCNKTSAGLHEVQTLTMDEMSETMPLSLTINISSES